MGSRSIEAAVDECVAWLRSLGAFPQFDRVLVTEDRNAKGSGMPTAVAPAQFQARFDEILANLGDRSWVNLHAVEVQDDSLVLAVEYIPGGPSVHEPGRISVMFSGPEGKQVSN